MTWPSQNAHVRAGTSHRALAVPAALALVAGTSLSAQSPACPPAAATPLAYLLDAARYLAFAGWLFLAAEYVSTLLMRKWTFRVGIPFKGSSFPAPTNRLPHYDVESDTVEVRYLDRDQWLFRHKQQFFEFHTPFPIRGVAVVQDGEVQLQGRQMSGGLVFMLGFAVLMGPVVGAALGAVMWGIGYVIERARFDSDCREVARLLGATNEPA